MSVPEKYTDLPAADLPLGGGEIICLVQDGVSVQATAADVASPAPVYVAVAPAAGTYNDVVLPGADDFVFDVSTAGGNVIYTGFVSQRDGQRLIFSNVNANLLEFAALTGSVVGNQIRVPTDLAVIQNQTLTLQFSEGAGAWLAV